MRALVIGADGFVGRWLIPHLVGEGDDVTAIVGPRYARPLTDVSEVIQLDVRNTGHLAGTVADARPDAIFYLAGVTSRDRRDDVEAAVGISVSGALAACVGAGRLPDGAKLLYVSSGYVYAGSASPLREEDPTRPMQVYAAAKLAGERALEELAAAIGVRLVIARPFNHIGPGQSTAFVAPRIAEQIAAFAPGSERVVQLAIGQVRRDFSDVRDVVRAYRLLIDSGPAGVYNVASGRATSIRELAETMLDVAGMDGIVRTESEQVSGEPPVLCGDATKLRSLGWSARVPLRKSLADVLDHARNRVS